MNPSRSYPAKILLIGEYTVLLGSEALAVPFEHFSGKWCQVDGEEYQVRIFREWVGYLLKAEGIGTARLDLKGLLQEVNDGLRFCSDIPIGSGLGSSGALTAAVLDRFGNMPADPDQLKNILGRIESFFHGKSSGLDPLVSLADQPVLTGRKTRLVNRNIWKDFQAKAHLFLWNSGVARETGPLVRYFTDRLTDPEYHQKISGQLIPANESAIAAVLSGDTGAFCQAWERISALQLELFEHMIPEQLREIWASGLEKGHYFFKLCGAGGGGFFLAYAPQSWPEDIREHGRIMPLLSSSD